MITLSLLQNMVVAILMIPLLWGASAFLGVRRGLPERQLIGDLAVAYCIALTVVFAVGMWFQVFDLLSLGIGPMSDPVESVSMITVFLLHGIPIALGYRFGKKYRK